VCGGFQGVAQGQVEAARALGLPMWLTMWHVVLPQAIHKVNPPLTNAAIVMVKNISLVPIGGIFDVLSDGRRQFAGRGAFATANRDGEPAALRRYRLGLVFGLFLPPNAIVTSALVTRAEGSPG
jgi:hypothetical protein